MRAVDVAVVLNAAGIVYSTFVEGDKDRDGAVGITPTVLVHVPTVGDELRLVELMPDGGLLFHAATNKINRLIALIRELDQSQCHVTKDVASAISALCR